MTQGCDAASVRCGGARLGGEVSRLDKKGGLRRGRAGSVSMTAARKELSVLGMISAGSGWGVDAGSISGGFWSRSVSAAAGSNSFGLPRDTLEQVCR